MLKRWHWLIDGPCPTDVPFVSSARMLDTSGTMAASIRNAPPNCVAIAIRYDGLGLGGRAIADCERAARHKGIRLLWIRRRRASLTADGEVRT